MVQIQYNIAASSGRHAINGPYEASWTASTVEAGTSGLRRWGLRAMGTSEAVQAGLVTRPTAPTSNTNCPVIEETGHER